MDHDSNQAPEGWRYFQYLETSCFRILEQQIPEPAKTQSRSSALIKHILSVIKLHALLGSRIVLNSSSPLELAVAHLFCDAEFRQFLAENPWFMKMTSVYSLPGQPTRRDIVLASMDRVTSPEWIASSIPESEPIRRLAAILLNSDSFDAELLLGRKERGGAGAIIRDWEEYRLVLEGMVRSVCHFGKNEHATVAKMVERRPGIHEMLTAAETRPKLQISGNHAEAIEATNKFIALNFDKDPQRVSMSEIISQTSDPSARHPFDGRILEQDDPLRRVVLETCSHAYNAGMAVAMKPDVGSYAFYSNGAPIGVYIDGLRDVLLPTSESVVGGLDTLTGLMPLLFRWSPSHLSWLDITHAFRDPEIAESAKVLRVVLASNESDVQASALIKHIALLQKPLAHVQPLTDRPWAWIINGLLLFVGASVPQQWQFVVQAAADSVKMADKAMCQLVAQGRRYIIADTLNKAAADAKAREHFSDERPS